MWYTRIRTRAFPYLREPPQLQVLHCARHGTSDSLPRPQRGGTSPLETIYSLNGLAGVLRLQLSSGPRRTIACVYSKFSQHDKQEVDLFLETMKPYDILKGDYNDDIWSPNPTRLAAGPFGW